MKEELYTELSIELNALKIKHFKLESIVNNIANTFSKDTVKSSDGDMAYGHIMDLNINIDTIFLNSKEAHSHYFIVLSLQISPAVLC
jgi:hypothetical protein